MGVAVVEIGIVQKAGFLCGTHIDLAHLADVAWIRDKHRPMRAVKFVVEFHVAFLGNEVRKNGFPAPQVGSGETSPGIPVGGTPAQINLQR